MSPPFDIGAIIATHTEGRYVPSVGSAFLGGWVMKVAGYGMVCLLATFLVALATLCSGGGKARPDRTTKAS